MTLTLKKKLEVVDEAILKKKVRQVALAYGVQPQHIRRWKKSRTLFLECIACNPTARTTHKGAKIRKACVETEVLASADPDEINTELIGVLDGVE